MTTTLYPTENEKAIAEQMHEYLRHGVRFPHSKESRPIEERAATTFALGQYQVDAVDRGEGCIALIYKHYAPVGRDGTANQDYRLDCVLSTGGQYEGLWFVDNCECKSKQTKSGETTDETGECKHQRAAWYMLNNLPEYRVITGELYGEERRAELQSILPSDPPRILASWGKRKRAEAEQARIESLWAAQDAAIYGVAA